MKKIDLFGILAFLVQWYRWYKWYRKSARDSPIICDSIIVVSYWRRFAQGTRVIDVEWSRLHSSFMLLGIRRTSKLAQLAKELWSPCTPRAVSTVALASNSEELKRKVATGNADHCTCMASTPSFLFSCKVQTNTSLPRIDHASNSLLWSGLSYSSFVVTASEVGK